jgi:hypothetical protein
MRKQQQKLIDGVFNTTPEPIIDDSMIPPPSGLRLKIVHCIPLVVALVLFGSFFWFMFYLFNSQVGH